MALVLINVVPRVEHGVPFLPLPLGRLRVVEFLGFWLLLTHVGALMND